MNVEFYKYQGAGNDFILLDNRSGTYQDLEEKFVMHLCDRRFGIGADGLMLLNAHPQYDFEMVYYNADGRPGSMCGNGGRCIVAFAKKLGVIFSETNFLAVDGPHYARISDIGTVDLQMINVHEVVKVDGSYVLNTGSPHYIKMVEDLQSFDVLKNGREIRYGNDYKENGINVNFTEHVSERLHVRTYERGVEDETFACGTGVTAAAIVHARLNALSGDVKIPVTVKGGELEISFRRSGDNFTDIFLSGPAEFVFEGKIASGKV